MWVKTHTRGHSREMNGGKRVFSKAFMDMNAFPTISAGHPGLMLDQDGRGPEPQTLWNSSLERREDKFLSLLSSALQWIRGALKTVPPPPIQSKSTVRKPFI